VFETGPNKGRDHKSNFFRKEQLLMKLKITDEKYIKKARIEIIDKNFTSAVITKEKRMNLKLQKLKVRAAAGGVKVSAEQEEKLNQVVQDKVDGRGIEKDTRSGGRSIIMETILMK
jgi:hypothetical protein